MRWRPSADLSWHCVCVGSLDRDPAFVERLRRRARRTAGWATGCASPGPRIGADLERSYAAADVLVLASRAETYGMVVTEALARGLPVVAAEVGGVPEALGHGADGDPARAARSARTIRRRSAPRCGRGSATPSCGERLRRAARERRASLAGLVGDHVRRRRASWPGRRDDCRGHPGQPGTGSPCASLPTPRPGAATSSSGSARRLPPAGRRGDPRPRRAAPGRWAAGSRRCCPGRSTGSLHDRDADLLALAAADRPGAAADGAAVTVETRQSDITRLDPGDLAGATLITASALLDLLTGDELAGWSPSAPAPVPGAADAVGRRSRRADPADPLDARVAAAFDAHQRRTTRRGRLLGPDAVAAAVEASAGSGPRSSSGPARGGSAPAEADLAAEWFAGWVGAALRAAGRAGRRDRRLRAPASGGGASRTARRHRGPRRPAGPAVEARHRAPA